MRPELNSPALPLGVRALQPQLSFLPRQDGAGILPRSEKLHFNAHREMGLLSSGKQWERGNGDNQVPITAMPNHRYRGW